MFNYLKINFINLKVIFSGINGPFWNFESVIIILVLLFVCMNYVPNQNGKFLEVMLAGFNSDAVKATFRHLYYLKMTLPFFQVLQRFLPILLPACHTQ